jgi:hypothetical protein
VQLGKQRLPELRFAILMNPIRSSVLVAFLATVVTACGGDSHRTTQSGTGARGTTDAGAGAVENAGAGADHGVAGTGLVEAGGNGGIAARGGGGAGTSGDGNGATSAGMSSAAAAGAAAGAGAGGAPNGGAPRGGAPGGGTRDGGAPNGGAPRGGASAAGTSSMSGAAGANLIDPPPNCQSTSQSADASSCSYDYTCDALTHFDDCHLDSGGVWSCECATFASITRYFEIEGVGALDACGTIARICESDVTASTTRTCRTLEQTADTGSCSAHATCGYALELDLGPGVVARTIDHYWSQCKPTTNYLFNGGNGFDCWCQGGAFDKDYNLVTAPSLDQVCGPVRDFCTAEKAPVFSGRVCGEAEPYGTVATSCPGAQNCQGCLMAEDCSSFASLAQGVSIIEDQQDNPTQNVVCRPQGSTLHCDCEANPTDLGRDPTVPTDTVQTCVKQRNVCPN